MKLLWLTCKISDVLIIIINITNEVVRKNEKKEDVIKKFK